MRWVAIISGVFVGAVIALAVHIHVVTRPRVDGHSRGMARIDLHQTISRAEGDSIVAWLYRQKGVDHVLVNPQSATVVFTYLPAVADAGQIAKRLRDGLSYRNSVRYLPTAAEVRRSCPMRATVVTNRIYEFLKRIF